MTTTRWAAGTFHDLPVLAWEWQATLTLLPGQRTVVVDETGMFDGTGVEDAVNGVVSHLLEQGLELCRSIDAPPERGAPSGWRIHAAIPYGLRVTDRDGSVVLEVDDLDEGLAAWAALVAARHGCVLYSGTGLLGDDGVMGFGRALVNGTLVCGWAEHAW
jgi:hypothetical protein